jgi:hypothetical protein
VARNVTVRSCAIERRCGSRSSTDRSRRAEQQQDAEQEQAVGAPDLGEAGGDGAAYDVGDDPTHHDQREDATRLARIVGVVREHPELQHHQRTGDFDQDVEPDDEPQADLAGSE